MAILPVLLAVLIDAAPLAAAQTAEMAPLHTYLHPPADGCDSRASGDEIVVCGSKDLDAHFRLHPDDDDRFAQHAVRAETKVGGGTLALKVDPRKADDAQDDVYFRPVHSQLRLHFTIPF